MGKKPPNANRHLPMKFKYLAKQAVKNTVEAIKPGLNHKSIEKAVAHELHDSLQELCKANLNQLANNQDKDLEPSQREKINSALHTKYFQTTASRDGYDGHYRIDKFFQEHQNVFKTELFTSSRQYVLSNTPSKDFLYCRTSPTEDTKTLYDQIIPSRDFACHSYPWANLLSIHTLTPNTFTNSATQILPKRSGNELVDVFFFGLLGDPQRGMRQILTLNEFRELLAERPDSLASFSKAEKFEFLAFKFFRHNRKTKSDPENIRNKSYFIFIDSLDTSIFDTEEVISLLPNLQKIASKSINFKHFTSSGFWTYPCIHSIHSGIPPFYSASWFKLTPQEALFHNEDLYAKKMAKYAGACLRGLGCKPKSLTSILRDHCISSAAIKSSSITSNVWNILDGTDVSIENSTIDLIPHHIETIDKTSEKNIDAYFIDIDTLHRGPFFFKERHKDWLVDSMDWIEPKQTKEQRLLGIREDKAQARQRELSQLIKVDEILGKILAKTRPEDNIIIYSDNGSQNWSQEINPPFSLPSNSSATFAKIWQPTLLVSCPVLNSQEGGKSSEELVSTHDLFNIIMGCFDISVDSSLNDSVPRYGIMPVSLGGSTSRTQCLSFGMNVANNKLLELIVRKQDCKGYCMTYDLNKSNEDFPLTQNVKDILESFFPGQIFN